MRAALALGLAALSASIACQRAPPEDFASHPSAPVSTAAPAVVRTQTSMLAGRCILPTPSQPARAGAVGPANHCPPDPETVRPPARVSRVIFPEAGGAAIEAEVVSSPHDTARGLMYRASLEENRGMLFDLRVRDDHKFWMHNTCIPLDLLYVDEDGLIVGLVENAPTLNDDARGVGCPSRYVLEVNAGWARRHGVKAGQHMTIPTARQD